jgi:hypothetical protein
MSNPFEEISLKLDAVLDRLSKLEKEKSVPDRIPFQGFCKDFGITRPTAYAWADRGLIKIEKIGGRNFIPSSSISVNSKKYNRTKEAA